MSVPDKPSRVAGPVELLVVLADRARPVAQPIGDGPADQLETLRRMRLQHSHSSAVGLPGLRRISPARAACRCRAATLPSGPSRCPPMSSAVVRPAGPTGPAHARNARVSAGRDGSARRRAPASRWRRPASSARAWSVAIAGELLGGSGAQARPRNATARGRETPATASTAQRGATSAAPGARSRTAQRSRSPSIADQPHGTRPAAARRRDQPGQCRWTKQGRRRSAS